jgi:hypothetical protein
MPLALRNGWLMIQCDRSKPPRAHTKSTNAASHPVTTPLLRMKTASSHTASTTSTGAQTPRRSASTSTASSMCPNQRRPKIRWRRRVRIPAHPSVYVDQSADLDVSTVRQMSELVSQVKDEQSYIVVRERTHRNTAESTNSRIKWWSIFQLAVLTGQGFFQVWWLKRFFEVSSAHLRHHREWN